jgi:hypothetical protein
MILTSSNHLHLTECNDNFVVQFNQGSFDVYFTGSKLISFQPIQNLTSTQIIKFFVHNIHIIVFGIDHFQRNNLSIYSICGEVVTSFPIHLFEGYKAIENGVFDGERVVFNIQDWISNTHVFQYSLDGRVLGHYCLTEQFHIRSIDSQMNLTTVTQQRNINKIDDRQVSRFNVSTYDLSGNMTSSSQYGPVRSQYKPVNSRYGPFRGREEDAIMIDGPRRSQFRRFFVVRGSLCALEDTTTGFILSRLHPNKLSEKSFLDESFCEESFLDESFCEESFCEESTQESKHQSTQESFWDESTHESKLSDLEKHQKHLRQFAQVVANERSLFQQHEEFTFTFPLTPEEKIVVDPDGNLFILSASFEVEGRTISRFNIWV